MLHVTNPKIRIYICEQSQLSRDKSCERRHENVDLDRYTTVTWRKCLVDVFVWIIFLCLYRSKSAKILGILSEQISKNSNLLKVKLQRRVYCHCNVWNSNRGNIFLHDKSLIPFEKRSYVWWSTGRNNPHRLYPYYLSKD